MEPTHFESLYPSDSRYGEIKKILEFVKQGNSCQLISFSGVGKSNVLALLAYNSELREKHLGDIKKWFHFVPLDFSEIKNRNLLDITKYIFLSLADSLKAREKKEEYEAVHGLLVEHLGMQDEMVLFQGLKKAIEYLSVEKELTVTLLCDRFEEYTPMVTAEFFSNLKVLRNRAKYRFSAVFSVLRPIEDTLEPSLLADFHELVVEHRVYLPIMDQPSLDFRLQYHQKVSDKKLDQKTLDRIVSLTSGHGKLTLLCINEVLHDSQPDVDAAYFLSKSSVKNALTEIWSSLTPSEQKSLLTPTPHDNPYLKSVFLLDKGDIAIPLFTDFLLTQKKEEVQNTHIMYHPEAQEITKGDIKLSEKLTAAEFRLLKHLIEHGDTVIERQQIIDVVWGTAASTSGVTDQALDQLIFRLRRKIEDDPNTPTHLQTVKGRGFKFSP